MDAVDHIKALVAEYPVVLFMKGTPQYPMDAGSQLAAELMQRVGTPFHTVNLLAEPGIRASLPAYANWATFPQLFVQGELIGGSDVMRDLDASGELARMLREADVAANQSTDTDHADQPKETP